MRTITLLLAVWLIPISAFAQFPYPAFPYPGTPGWDRSSFGWNVPFRGRAARAVTLGIRREPFLYASSGYMSYTPRYVYDDSATPYVSIGKYLNEDRPAPRPALYKFGDHEVRIIPRGAKGDFEIK